MFGLKAGDRLDPGLDVVDVSQFEFIPVPFRTTWWRMTREDWIMHDSPLFKIEGVSALLYGVDLLHAWHLGGCAIYIAEVFWLVLKSKLFAPPIRWLTAADCTKLGLMRLRSEMWLYYKVKTKTDPNFKIKGSKAFSTNTQQCTHTPHVYPSFYWKI
jgi:hypothetical protein